MSALKRKIIILEDEPRPASKARTSTNGNAEGTRNSCSQPSTTPASESLNKPQPNISDKDYSCVWVPKLGGTRENDKWEMARVVPPYNSEFTATVKYQDSGTLRIVKRHEIGRRNELELSPFDLGHIVLADLLPGFIGDVPCSRNHFRFLVFLENGNAGYFAKESLSRIATLHEDYNAFLKKFNPDFAAFLDIFSIDHRTGGDRVLVKLSTEEDERYFHWNDGTNEKPIWHKMVVTKKDVDCVVARRAFSPESVERTIYCGSFRIRELWQLKYSDSNRLRRGSTVPRKDHAIIAVTREGKLLKFVKRQSVKQEASSEPASPPKPPTRASLPRVSPPQVAPPRASDTKKIEKARFMPPIPTLPLQKFDLMTRFDHICSHDCIKDIKPIVPSSQFRGYPHLLRPLFYLFKRSSMQKQLALRHRSKICRDISVEEKANLPSPLITYTSPCGFVLIDEGDVFVYLSFTQFKVLDIDDFTFDDADISKVVREENCFVFRRDISNGLEKQQPVSLINSIDHSEPQKFTYIVEQTYQSVMLAKGSDPLAQINQFKSSCKCTENCSVLCDCLKLTSANDDYIPKGAEDNYKYKRLHNPLPLGIYECNENCHCDSRCFNRVVQNGTKCLFQVFRTKKKGFGVRTLAYIPKGTFIGFYAGKVKDDDSSILRCNEYLTNLDFIETAEQHKQDYECAPLVDLTERHNMYTRDFLKEGNLLIDAFKIGSFTRFINHSCEPNIFVQCVFVNTHDLRIPHVAFFALRAIEAGEEIGWDYSWASQDSTEHKKCFCGAAKCRNLLS